MNGWDLEVVLAATKSAGVRFPPRLAAQICASALVELARPGGSSSEERHSAEDRKPPGLGVLISVEGDVKVGELCDQFFLGELLYRMLSGRPPFGDVRTEDELAPEIPGLPPLLRHALNRMLATPPQARFQSPEACARALETYVAEGGAPPTTKDVAAFIAGLLRPLPAVDESPSEWEPGGPSLDAEGVLSGHAVRRTRTAPREPLSLLPTAPPPNPFASSGPELELAERAPRVAEPVLENYREIPPPPRPPSFGWGWVLPTLLAVALLGGAGWALWHSRDKLGPPHPRGSASLIVDSDPSGAQVRVGGSAVGSTPVALDNLYPPGPITIEVSHPGYRTWKGMFVGGEQTVLHPVLRRR